MIDIFNDAKWYLYRSSLSIRAKNIYPLSKQESYQKNILDIPQNQNFTFFGFWYFSYGVSPKTYFEHSSKLIFSHFSICSSFSFILIYHIFGFYWYFHHGKGHLVIYTKIINQNYPLQHSRNLVYHHWLLIHHLQVIPHGHLSCLDLIISTKLPIRTRTTY